METTDLIAIDTFCLHHGVEVSFIRSLEEFGLIEVVPVNEVVFIHAGQLPRLEKIIRLHTDLEINLAGIDAVTHLLDQISDMQEEMNTLRNRLRMYELNQE